MKTTHRILGALAGAITCLAALPVGAVTVLNATRVEITGAPDYLQIAEVQAIEFGSGVNVAAAAKGATATAFSSGYGTTPAGAIDGNDDPLLYCCQPGTQFYLSADNSASEKLTINLGRAADLTSLRIVGRTDCCRERDFWNVAIFDGAGELLFSGALDARTSPTFDAIATFDDPPVTGAIPEPSMWAMMILGFGAAGAVIRSRRRALSFS